MQRLLDWIDESSSSLIRLAYLFAGITAVAAYFGAGNLPPDVLALFNGILPWALAGAIETHTYLSARRVRGHYQQLQASTQGTAEYEQAMRGLKVNLGILAALLAFSMYNQAEYLAATWHPANTALTLPAPWSFLVRAVVTPGAFMLAAFLAPMGENLAGQVRTVAHDFTRRAFKVAKLQWQARLIEMQREKEDVTAALVQLVEDPQERRIIETIHAAMYGPRALALPEPPDADHVPYYREAGSPTWQRLADPSRPPTGGGTPEEGPQVESGPVHDSRTAAIANGHVVALPPRVSQRVRSARRRRASGRGVRTTDNFEEQARAAWTKGARSKVAMVRATGMGPTAAASWVRTLKAEERAAATAMTAQAAI